jgi:uncharacterized phage-associated protein
VTFSEKKLKNAILFFAGHAGVSDLGVTKLYKLVYFADARMLREADRSITGSKYIKYPHGPVPSRGERILKRMRKAGSIDMPQRDFHGYTMTAVVSSSACDPSLFDADELKVLESVANDYGMSTAADLSHRAHLEPSWEYASDLQELDPTLMLYGAEEDPEGL